MRLIRLSSARSWRPIRRLLVGLAVAGLLVILLGLTGPGQALFGCGLLGLVLLESKQLREIQRETQRQQHALAQIRPLTGELPVDLSRWAADPMFVHQAVRLAIETRPRLILECGSGSSTVIIARCLRALGGGQLITLEHDPAYAGRTMELLRLFSVADLVTVVTAPLVSRDLNGRVYEWYSPAYEPLLGGPIDALVVDGPPGSGGPLARYPAVPLLKPHLSPSCWILLDDGNRPDEGMIAHTWARELGVASSYLEGGRGGWLLRRQAAAETAVLKG
jgi:hypothetical protein